MAIYTKKEAAPVIFFTTYRAPLGDLILTARENALTGLVPAEYCPDLTGFQRQDTLPLFSEVRGWLDDYFAGIPRPIPFPLASDGTDFQKRVWAHLLDVPFGITTSYGAIAKAMGKPKSAQAVGQAVGKNPIAIIIPCHRCLGAKGQLTGYAWGLEKKIWLLRHEDCGFQP